MNYKGHIDGGGLDEVDAYYPGNNYVDWIGFNPYNWKYCGGDRWQPFAEVAWPMVEYLTTNDRYLTAGEPKPLIVGETGVHEGRGETESKAQWFADMSAALQTEDFSAIKAVVYFNQVDPNFCDWHWDSSPDAAKAFAALVTDPFFHPASVGSEG
jgi:beta-mannanase